VPKPLTRWIVRGTVASLGLTAAIALAYLPSASQSASNARVVEIVPNPNGNSRVSIDLTPANVGSTASVNQRITTEQTARASLQLGQTAAARLGKQSTVLITNQCVQLDVGQAIVTGNPGCLASLVITPQDAIVVLEQDEQQRQISVLRGSATLADRENPNIQPITLTQGQGITLSPEGNLGPVRALTNTEFDTLIQGDLLQGFQEKFPQQETLTAIRQQLFPAAQAEQPRPTPKPTQTPVPDTAKPKPSPQPAKPSTHPHPPVAAAKPTAPVSGTVYAARLDHAPAPTPPSLPKRRRIVRRPYPSYASRSLPERTYTGRSTPRYYTKPPISSRPRYQKPSHPKPDPHPLPETPIKPQPMPDIPLPTVPETPVEPIVEPINLPTVPEEPAGEVPPLME